MYLCIIESSRGADHIIAAVPFCETDEEKSKQKVTKIRDDSKSSMNL